MIRSRRASPRPSSWTARLALFAAVALLVAGVVWVQRDPALRPILDIAARKASVSSSPNKGTNSLGPNIRVALTDDPVRSLLLKVDGPFTITLPGDTRILHRGSGLPATAVELTPQGFRLGRISLSATRIEIRAERDPGVWVDDHLYRGAVRLLRSDAKRLRAINVLPVDAYLASVVDSEMPRDFGREARAAQAVAARTYAFMAIRDSRPAPGESTGGRDWDLYASVRSQKYLGVRYRDANGNDLAAESDDSRAAVSSTSGWVLTWQGKLFRPYYSACCGGHTLRGDILFPDAAAPHAGVRCTGCREARWYRWTVDLTRAEALADLAALARAKGRTLKTITAIEELDTTAPDEIPRFRIRGDGGTFEATGHELRQALGKQGVMSPRFAIRPAKDGFHITGRGHGHGAGLCQWGARGLATQGQSVRQILAHYYPGSTLVRARW